MRKARTSMMFFTVFIVMFALVATPVISFGAERQVPLALTSPPPTEFNMYTFFDSSNEYLDQGDVTIQDNLDQTVTIEVSTVAYSNVASIGATVNLQRWTGTTWIDVGPATTVSGKNKWYFSGEIKKTSSKGYYYRVRSVHWISHNNVYEQGQTVSGYILAN